MSDSSLQKKKGLVLQRVRLQSESDRSSFSVCKSTAIVLESALLALSEKEQSAELLAVLTDDSELAAWVRQQAAFFQQKESPSQVAESQATASQVASLKTSEEVEPTQSMAQEEPETTAEATAETTSHAPLSEEQLVKWLSKNLLGLLVCGFGEPSEQAQKTAQKNAPSVSEKAGDEAAGEGEIFTRLARLVAKLSQLTKKQASYDRELEKEKLQAMRDLAYGASHEINNPLANIAIRAQTLSKEEPDPERRQALLAIHENSLRAHEMISDLMLYARPPKIERVEFASDLLVKEVVGEFCSEAIKRRGIEVTVLLPGDLPTVIADRTQLGVALRAVIRNGVEAIGMNGHIEISLHVDKENKALRQEEAGKTIIIRVRDNGPGVSEETRRMMFNPYYSGREAGRGLGFGLSKCWRIVREHEGRVEVDSTLGLGTEIRILLPQ